MRLVQWVKEHLRLDVGLSDWSKINEIDIKDNIKKFIIKFRIRF